MGYSKYNGTKDLNLSSYREWRSGGRVSRVGKCLPVSGPALYSYGEHYCLAVRTPGGRPIFNVQKVTCARDVCTSRQRRELIEAGDFITDYSGMDEAEKAVLLADYAKHRSSTADVQFLTPIAVAEHIEQIRDYDSSFRSISELLPYIELGASKSGKRFEDFVKKELSELEASADALISKIDKELASKETAIKAAGEKYDGVYFMKGFPLIFRLESMPVFDGYNVWTDSAGRQLKVPVRKLTGDILFDLKVLWKHKLCRLPRGFSGRYWRGEDKIRYSKLKEAAEAGIAVFQPDSILMNPDEMIRKAEMHETALAI